MIQLSPNEIFTIAYGLEDHTDSNTYYVQAEIRNTKSNALLGTVNLTDRGNGYFTGDWQVPSDGSGRGFWITVRRSVYTDSGYTIKSLYGDKFDQYLVQTRVNPNSLGGGGGVSIDYEKIQKIIDNSTNKLADRIISRYEDTVKSIQKSIRDLVTSDELKSQLETLLTSLENVRAAIRDLPGPTKPTDIKPILRSLEAITKIVGMLPEMNAERVKSLTDEVIQKLTLEIGVSSNEIKQATVEAIKPLQTTIDDVAEMVPEIGKTQNENNL